ncbi:MAG: hypothetical protein V4819_21270 [Verrucomicrobiota bacterium]
MNPSLLCLLPAIALSVPLLASTVVITTVPDVAHGLNPLTSLGGVPLAVGTQIRAGAFPGLSDDAILDLASQGGLTQVTAAFVPFGSSCSIGQGVDGAAGGFEISVKDSGSASWVNEAVSLLIQTSSGEFLIARFTGKVFEAETETGLEPFLTLHLADAKVLVGSRNGTAKLATSTAPDVGSYSTWLASFPGITDPALVPPGADADSDGRSNFLEYATGGNPALSGDAPACEILPADEGGLWVRFSRVPGLGTVRYSLQSSGDVVTPWKDTEIPIEPDPGNPALMRLRLAAPLSAHGFFRLIVESAP